QGTVYDQSGAFVPNVTIEIRSVDKGTLHTVTTDDRGRFREPLLLPGTYELEATATGFQLLVMKDIQLTVGQDAVLDVKLAIQATTGQVTVTAEQPAINLASAALSGTVERKQ